MLERDVLAGSSSCRTTARTPGPGLLNQACIAHLSAFLSGPWMRAGRPSGPVLPSLWTVRCVWPLALPLAFALSFPFCFSVFVSGSEVRTVKFSNSISPHVPMVVLVGPIGIARITRVILDDLHIYLPAGAAV